MAIPAEIRAVLAAFARSTRKRKTGFVPAMPSRWEPTMVTDPKSRQPFTEDGCWQYIADQIEAGCDIEQIELDQPAGKKGYVLKLAGAQERPIYVKLQNCGDHVRGRSFHLSETEKERKEVSSVKTLSEQQSCKMK